MVEVVCGVRMGVGVGRVGNGGEGLVSSEGNVSMADGGRARWRDCCRELWEDLPYRLPFTLDIGELFLWVGLQGRGS